MPTRSCGNEEGPSLEKPTAIFQAGLERQQSDLRSILGPGKMKVSGLWDSRNLHETSEYPYICHLIHPWLIKEYMVLLFVVMYIRGCKIDSFPEPSCSPYNQWEKCVEKYLLYVRNMACLVSTNKILQRDKLSPPHSSFIHQSLNAYYMSTA